MNNNTTWLVGVEIFSDDGPYTREIEVTAAYAAIDGATLKFYINHEDGDIIVACFLTWKYFKQP